MSQRIHQLTEVSLSGRTAQGRFRQAVSGDLDQVSEWVEGFMTEAGETQGIPREVAASRISAGQLYLWDEREPVSMAAWTGKTPGGVRVNLVYTPPDKRGRGYATACVAALSRQLLGEGNRFCCLYTDLDNPTSNAIYARIGYRPVSDASMYTLTA
jgi:predicted GNAT family acetyltransferase